MAGRPSGTGEPQVVGVARRERRLILGFKKSHGGPCLPGTARQRPFTADRLQCRRL